MASCRPLWVAFIISYLGVCIAPQTVGQPIDSPPPIPEAYRELTLDEALDLALVNNHQRPISRYALRMAEAQRRQALSAYWPDLKLQGSYELLDENVTFDYPALNVATPEMSVPLGGQTIVLPPGALGPGLPPNGIEVPLPDTDVQVPGQEIATPAQKIDVLGRRTMVGELVLEYPIYTGGMRPAILAQAEAGIDAAREKIRRTDLQVVYDVQRMYFASLMTRELYRIGDETLQRLKGTLALTEGLYQAGSESVQKTDYLRNKMTVEGMEAMIAILEANREMALAALVNTMGLPWDTRISLARGQAPFAPLEITTDELVATTWQFNPDWGELDAGLRAAEARVDEVRSGHKPKVLFTGKLRRMDNSLGSGVDTAENRNSWSVGVGFQLPLFSGFRTRAQIEEARARLDELREQRLLLRDALGIRVRALVLQMRGSHGQSLAAHLASATAEENRELNMRAYQAGLLETKDVLEAQMMEAFMKAQEQKALHDHAQAQALLGSVVGAELEGLLRPVHDPEIWD